MTDTTSLRRELIKHHSCMNSDGIEWRLNAITKAQDKRIAELEMILNQTEAELLSTASDLKDAKDNLARVTAERDDARVGPWPTWAESILTVLREFGYRFDDIIDLPEEVSNYLRDYPDSAVNGLIEDRDDATARAETAEKERDAERAVMDGLAAQDVLLERARQISAEGWLPQHDDTHDRGELADAAACYAILAGKGATATEFDQPGWWPWHWTWWKSTTRRRDLVKAGALIIAEIERLDRLAAYAKHKEGRNA